MTPSSRQLLILTAALTLSFLIFQVLKPDRGWTSAQALCRLVEEKQRREALDSLMERTVRSVEAKKILIHRLIDRKLTLEEVLPAFSEIQVQAVDKVPEAEVRKDLLSREGLYESILCLIGQELRDNPSLAQQVLQRVQGEWHALSVSRRESS